MKKFLIVLLIAVTLIIGASAVIGGMEYMNELIANIFDIGDFDLSSIFENIGYQEDASREDAQKALSDRATETSEYYMTLRDTPDTFMERMRLKYQDTLHFIDINRNKLTDLSLNKTQFVQNKMLDLGDEDSIDEVYGDFYGSDKAIKILNDTFNLVFTQLHRKNNDYYIEAESRAPFFTYDWLYEKYNHEDDVWELWVNIPKWNEETGELIKPDFTDIRVYEPKIKYAKEIKWKDEGTNDEYPTEFIWTEQINEFDNDQKKAVEKAYYEVDSDGQPLAPEDAEFPPKKHLAIPRYAENREIELHSFMKYNYKIVKKKVPTFDTADMTESEIQNEIEEGEEGAQWIYDYTGTRFKSYASVDDDKNLIYNAEDTDFRYHYENGQIIDTGIENRNEEYLFDLDIERIRDIDTLELVSPFVEGFADSGLGTINIMINKTSLDYLKGLSYKEIYDPQKVLEFMTELGSYDMSYWTLNMIKEGRYPDNVSNHPRFNEYMQGNDFLDYYKAIENTWGGNMSLISSFITEDGHIKKRKDVEDVGIEMFDKFFYNPEYNERIYCHAPYLTGTANSSQTKRDFIDNPNFSYETMVYELNENDLTFIIDWDFAGDLVSDIVTEYTEVNNLDLSSKFSHNKNWQQKQNEINSNGNLIYTSRDMSAQMPLVVEAANILGRYMFAYEEKEIFSKKAPDQPLVIGAYEFNRYMQFKGFDVYYDYTLSYNKKEYEKDSDGKRIKGSDGKYKYDIVPAEREYERKRLYQFDTTEDLEIYEKFTFSNEYVENEQIIEAVDNDFNVHWIETPEIPQDFKDSFEKAIGDEDELDYKKKTIDRIYFIPKFSDKTDSGTIREIEMKLDAAIFTIKPILREKTFMDEEYKSMSRRLNIHEDGIDAYERKTRTIENDYYIDQLRDYIKHHSYYVPLNMVFNDRRNEVKDDFYQVVNRFDFSETKIDFGLQNQKARLMKLIEESDIKKKLLNNSKSNDFALTIILGLKTEERDIGTGNLYVKFFDADTINAADGLNDKAISFELTKDDAENDYMAAEYIVTRFRNLLYYYKGNVPKAIHAYHFSPEYTDMVLENHPESFAKRPLDEVIDEYSYLYSERNTDFIDPYIVESTLSYLRDYQSIYDVARTDIRFFESIYIDVKQDVDDFAETTVNVFDKMIGYDLQNTGIQYVDNSHTSIQTDLILQAIFSGMTGENFTETDDFMLSQLLGGEYVSAWDGDWRSTNNYDVMSIEQAKQLGLLLKELVLEPYPSREEYRDFLTKLLNLWYNWGGGRYIKGREDTWFGYPHYVSAPNHAQSFTDVPGSLDCSGTTLYSLEMFHYPVYDTELFGQTATTQYDALVDKYGIPMTELEVGDFAFVPRSDGTMSHVGIFFDWEAETGEPLFFHMGGRYSKAWIGKVPSFTVFAKNPLFEENYMEN